MTVTQKVRPGMSRRAARRDVRNLFNWQPVIHDADILESAWSLPDRYGLAWRDAPLVAAALRAGCRYLLSEDFQEGMAFDGVTAIDPFERPYQSMIGG